MDASAIVARGGRRARQGDRVLGPKQGDDGPTNLAKRALERRSMNDLPSPHLARDPEPTGRGQWTVPAPGPWPTHLASQIHQCLVPSCGVVGVEHRPRSLAKDCNRDLIGFGPVHEASQDTTDVGVDDGDALPEGEARDRSRGVLPHAREGSKRIDRGRNLAAVITDDDANRIAERNGAAVIAQVTPRAYHLCNACLRQGLHRRERGHEVIEHVGHPGRLRLLEHDLAHQDPVGIGLRSAPRIGSATRAVPSEKGFPRCRRRIRLDRRRDHGHHPRRDE